MFEENADAKAIQASGYLEDLRNSARSEHLGDWGGKLYLLPVIICVFSSTREMTKEFMQAVSQAGLKTHEFVYILPWLQAEAKVETLCKN